MSGLGTGYDLSVTTYSPEGKLFQVNYAGKAVGQSGTTIGIACKNGVVVGVENIIKSELLVKSCARRVHRISKNSGLAVAGWLPDARKLVNKARSECKEYKDMYGIVIPASQINDRISSFVHMNTIYSWVRPYGVSTLVASYEEDKPSLYMIDPSGTSWGYHGVAVGKESQAAKNELTKIDFDQLDMHDAVKEIARILHKVHNSQKDKHYFLELGWVGEHTKGVFEAVPEDTLAEAIAYAEQRNKTETDGGDDEDDDEEDEDLDAMEA